MRVVGALVVWAILVSSCLRIFCTISQSAGMQEISRELVAGSASTRIRELEVVVGLPQRDDEPEVLCSLNRRSSAAASDVTSPSLI